MNLPVSHICSDIILLTSESLGNLRFDYGLSSDLYLRKIAYRFKNRSGCKPDMKAWANYKNGSYQYANIESTVLIFYVR